MTIWKTHPTLFGQKLVDLEVILCIAEKGTLDPLKEKFETRIAAYDYTLEKLGNEDSRSKIIWKQPYTRS